MKTYLFACVHNAGRSQMAAAFFNALADPAEARALSAGTAPGDRVHPEVVTAMREIGIDLGAARPRKLTPELAAQAQLLITMGCGDECPVVSGVRRDDWPLDDPKGQPIERVRAIRDDIRARVAALVAQETSRELPIVCTLDSGALRGRRQGLLSELIQRADNRSPLPDGVRLRFAAAADTLSTIARTLEAERQCCRFLRFTLVVEPDGGPFVLDLTGPPGTREFVTTLLDM